jgi:signal transduction histidine kinase
LGFSEVISTKVFGPAMDRYSEYATDIHASGSHLLSIINDILDLSKVEAGRAELLESDEALGEIWQSLRTLLESRFAEAGLEFVCSLPTPEPLVRVDRRKIVQVLVNILSNAAKFTPRGGRVTLEACLLADGDLVVGVTDTGIGIAPEDLETVLQPFGQVESVFSRQHHGTGLGLPLARAFIELHGGSLRIQSAPSQGTTVSVSLPASRVLRSVDRAQLRSALA